jgi:hypothetical protein
MNDQQRLEFAVKFAQTDFSTMREGDWLNLREDVADFISPQKRGIPPPGPYRGVLIPRREPLLNSKTEAEALQTDVYGILSEVVSVREAESRSSASPRLGWPINVRLAVMPSLPPAPPRSVTLYVVGSPRDVFLERLFSLLRQEPSNRILRCKALDCDQIFYRVRKQRYCSPRCQSRDFMRQFRKSNGEKESERNHKRYKARV